MQQLPNRFHARPQVEALEERWQPASLASFRAAFADFVAAHRASPSDEGERGRSGGATGHGDNRFECAASNGRGHGRHEHTRSEGRSPFWAKWGHGGRFDCDTHGRGKGCERHHHCDKPDPTPEPELGSLSGRVFVDVNEDGQFDAGDRPIAEAVIFLYWTDANGEHQERMTETLADGSYRFDELEGGIAYTIQEMQPFPSQDGPDYLGSLGGEQGDDVFSVFLEVGQDGVDYNFTERFGE